MNLHIDTRAGSTAVLLGCVLALVWLAYSHDARLARIEAHQRQLLREHHKAVMRESRAEEADEGNSETAASE